MLEYPNATAAAIDSPSAADFPRPLAAVNETVAFKLFSEIASINFKTAFACKPKFNNKVLKYLYYTLNHLICFTHALFFIPDPEFCNI